VVSNPEPRSRQISGLLHRHHALAVSTLATNPIATISVRWNDHSVPGSPLRPEARVVFDCPNVDPSQRAILLFESIGVGHERNQFEISSTPIAGGIPGLADERISCRDPYEAWLVTLKTRRTVNERPGARVAR
jgi:hypothetical protein